MYESSEGARVANTTQGTKTPLLKAQWSRRVLPASTVNPDIDAHQSPQRR